MDIFEYKVVEILNDINNNVEKRLNELGKLGWELVQPYSAGKYIFKRKRHKTS